MRPETFLCSLILLSLVVGCSTPKKTDPQLPIQTVEIVQTDSKAKPLRVKVKMPVPASAFEFLTQGYQFRRQHWEVVTPGIKIDYAHNKEVIYRDDKLPFNEVEFVVKYHQEDVTFDYELIKEFSDKSYYIYVGHFYLWPTDLTREETTEHDYRWHLKIRPRTGGKAVYPGSETNPPYVEDKGSGFFAYFGNLPTQKRGNARMILDPILPKWIKKDLLKTVPRIYEFYKEKTGIALNFQPLIFFSYDSPNSKIHKRDGGTRPGMLYLSISGKHWKIKTEERRLELLKFLAHESAHFWNARMFNYDTRNSKTSFWLHEGGAETFAFLSMWELGFYSDQKLLERIETYFSFCEDTLQSNPLNLARKKKITDTYYTCGFMIGVLSHFYAMNNEKREGVFEIWKELFKQAKKNRNRYSQEMYLEILENVSRSKELKETVGQLAEQGLSDLRTTLKTHFHDAGFKMQIKSANFSKSYEKKMGRAAVRKIMKLDCGFRNIRSTGTGYHLSGKETCKGIKQDFEVTKIEGHDVITAGVAGYDAAYTQCGKSGSVRLTNTKGVVVKATCRGIPKRTDPIAFLDFPDRPH